jgi:hypothetical protein
MPAPLNPGKLRLIDVACRQMRMRSFADLGAVWNVDGGYTFYAAGKHPIERAYLVDADMTQAVFEARERHPSVELIEANFGDPAVPRRIHDVDGVFLFDTLLHQVKPDWDAVLELYAQHTRLFLIFNPQYLASKTSVRLLDLGREEYFRNVPHPPEYDVYKMVFENPDAINPRHGRPNRDIPNIWQWGITGGDLMRKMESIGFQLEYFRNCGRFGNLRNFENHAFIFSRGGARPRHRKGAQLRFWLSSF